MGAHQKIAHKTTVCFNPLITMKFFLAIALICAFAFSTVQSAECTNADNSGEYTACIAVQTTCDTSLDLCDSLGVAVELCKDGVVAAFDAAITGLIATVTACECPVMTCNSDGAVEDGAVEDGAAFVAMSFM